MFGGLNETAAFEVLPGIAGADGDELQDAGVTIAIDHAAGASVADQFTLIEFVNIAHGSFPEVTTIQIQIPIQIKIFVPAQAAEFFGLLL